MNKEDYAMTLPELKWKVFLGAYPDQVQATLDAILTIKKMLIIFSKLPALIVKKGLSWK